MNDKRWPLYVTLACFAVLVVALCSPARAQLRIGTRPAAGAASSQGGLAQSAAIASNEDPRPPTDSPVLYLQGNDWVAGKPAATSQPDKFAWHAPAFTEPFEFDLHALTRVRFPVSSTPGWRDHEYRLELAGGDVLYGELVSVGEESLVFRSSLAGELRVKRSAARCLERCQANALVYLGPSGLAEWQMPRGADSWHEDDGHLVTDKDLASLYGKIDLPPKALIEFEVSSLFPPVFRLALGVGGEAAGHHKGFRLEVVDQDVIAVYETKSDIDVARVMTLAPGPERDRVHLRVLLDQEAQRAQVFSPEGLPLASVHVGVDAPSVLPGVFLEHKRGGLRLERLRIWRWTGEVPPPPAASRPQLHRVDGSVVAGKLTRYDAERRQFVLSTDQGEVVAGDEEAARIYFGEPAVMPERPLRISCADGTQLSGWFAGMNAERLLVDCKSIDTPQLESVGLPISSLANIAFLYAPAGETTSAERALVIRLEDGRMHGRLAPGKAENGHGPVAWLPAGSLRAGPLREEASARLTAQSLARFDNARAASIRRAELDGNAARRPPKQNDEGPARAGRDTIYLTTGDTFRCEVTSIDQGGVICRTASAEKQIAHDKVKAIDLAESADGSARGRPTFQEFARQAASEQVRPAQLGREKLQRLLTLPRLRRDDPPTQILCAANGDYLRGRLLSLVDGVVRFAVDDESRDYPRDRIAAIVWLHPEPTGAAEEDAANRPNQVHAVCDDGTRMTFVAKEIDERSLVGLSEVLGECHLPLDRVNELFLGDFVRQAATKVAYHGWTLTPAPDPKAFQEGDSPSEAGKDSPLVGRLAPDFELDLVDGSKFRLSAQKGQTVVLDFWASWCAPCVRSLPKLAQTVAAQEGNVTLVAVNLQQSADDAKAAIARMGLDIAVALDRDGAVAARYGAAAIPYTVVVNPAGQVARVFIGAGPDTETQLQAALDEATNPGSGESAANPGE
ncbi:MAG TPA: TlpA disulfide reductase family protein [Pirellulales bacterium]|nr:TlpA disulfide reductase family protein [Pirellulales bacterium]